MGKKMRQGQEAESISGSGGKCVCVWVGGAISFGINTLLFYLSIYLSIHLDG